MSRLIVISNRVSAGGGAQGGLAVALSADAVTRLYRRIQRGFDAVLGTVLAGLGVRLLGAE